MRCFDCCWTKNQLSGYGLKLQPLYIGCLATLVELRAAVFMKNKLEKDFDLQVRYLYFQINLKYVLSKVKYFISGSLNYYVYIIWQNKIIDLNP